MSCHPPTLPGLYDVTETVEIQPVKANPVRDEIVRLNAAAERVLERLQQGPATNVELSSPEIGGLRFGGRIFELSTSWQIEKEHVKGGVWRYRLIGRK